MSRLKDPRVIFATVVVLALMVASRMYLPVPLPHIQLPAEGIPGLPIIHIPLLGDLIITNTMIAVLTTDILLLVLVLLARRKMDMVPNGFQNVFEMVIEYWEGMAVQMLGEDRARRWLPLVLTLFLFVMLSNWAELIPGYDSVGILCDPAHCTPGQEVTHAEEDGEHHGEHTLFTVSWLGEEGRSFGIATANLVEAAEDDEHAEEGAPAEDAHAEGYGFVPFLRVASSDLNFTLALALIAVVAVEIVGLSGLGLGYLKKFFAFGWIGNLVRGDGSRPGVLAWGVLDVFVGFLELISELSRIVSFSFRLFGNLFAGQILLFVLPFLIPLLVVLPIYGLELFVGMIQGFVFAILTLAFMATALISHDEH